MKNHDLLLEAEPFELVDEFPPPGNHVSDLEDRGDAKPLYLPIPGREFGPRWKSRRPPGLPANVRGASSPGEAMPFVVQAAQARNLGDTFLRLMADLARTESNATFGLPANSFDARPEAQRPAGKARITAWGVFQFNRPAWCALNGFGSANCPTDLMPWSATPTEEIEKPVARYAEVFRGVRTAGGSDFHAARGVRLWQRSPAVEFRRYLQRGQASGDFDAAWSQVASSHRDAVDGRLRKAGLLPSPDGELDEASGFAGEEEWSPVDWFRGTAVGSYLGGAMEGALLRSAIRGGTTDENTLTDLVFYRRHPERNRRPISRDEPDAARLGQEWLNIRDTLVRPALRGTPSAPTPAPAQPALSPTPTPGSGYGSPTGGDVAARVVAEAQRHIGFAEGPNNANPFSAHFGAPNVAWCAYFVSYCYTKAGYPLAIGSSDVMLDHLRTRGRLLSNATPPQPADIVIFDWTLGDHDPAEHVGLVERAYRNTAGQIRVGTIEGNTSNGVNRREYGLGDSRIVGFGRLIGVTR